MACTSTPPRDMKELRPTTSTQNVLTPGTKLNAALGDTVTASAQTPKQNKTRAHVPENGPRVFLEMGAPASSQGREIRALPSRKNRAETPSKSQVTTSAPSSGTPLTARDPECAAGLTLSIPTAEKTPALRATATPTPDSDEEEEDTRESTIRLRKLERNLDELVKELQVLKASIGRPRPVGNSDSSSASSDVDEEWEDGSDDEGREDGADDEEREDRADSDDEGQENSSSGETGSTTEDEDQQ
ncbi:hypothetical protein EVG20_g7007 [Dentipellis fragilis]|uniref:Uncharacterized protein n=1 Tax=Dentipellis fragilis TaxID=205917 RepID=A0A4Y9YHD3_9AGAM|nr:hypothetical protein EVG20_g7007 [Dentipellis fragilis]